MKTLSLNCSAAVIGLSLAAAAQVCAQDGRGAATAPLSPAAMREDLIYLREQWLPRDLSFSPDERTEFGSVVESAIQRTGSLSPAQFALEVSRAVAVSGNAHTSADVDGFFTYLPIRVWWFADGLHIVEAQPEHADLLGARVERIGNFTAAQALERVAPFFSGTDEFTRFGTVSLLVSLDPLAHAGVIPSTEAATLTLARYGETRVVTLGPQRAPAPPVGGTGVLIPSPPGNPHQWQHVLDALDEPPPAFRSPLSDVTHEWLAGGDVFYIRNESTTTHGETRLDDKLLTIISTQVVPRRPRFVVVDLRLNTGGNFFSTALFAQILPKLVPEHGKIYVLVGNVTLSAAIATAMMLKGNGGEKVVFVGERMGDHAQFWAENPELSLPHSGIAVHYATGFHDWSGECSQNAHCFWATAIFATPGLSLEPDVRASLTFADYAAGHDTVLEAALALAQLP